jgi:hypothetical protein
MVIAQHKHSHRISLIRSGRYKVPQEWRDSSTAPRKTPLVLARVVYLLGDKYLPTIADPEIAVTREVYLPTV